MTSNIILYIIRKVQLEIYLYWAIPRSDCHFCNAPAPKCTCSCSKVHLTLLRNMQNTTYLLYNSKVTNQMMMCSNSKACTLFQGEWETGWVEANFLWGATVNSKKWNFTNYKNYKHYKNYKNYIVFSNTLRKMKYVQYHTCLAKNIEK